MESKEIWLKMDRDRRKALPGGIRTMNNALVKAIQPIIDSIQDYANVGDMVENAPGHIKGSEIEKGYFQLYGAVMPQFADRAMKGIKQGPLDDIWEEYTSRYVETDLANRVRHVTQTTENRIRGILAKGLKEGMSIDDIAESLDKLGLQNAITNRSTVIARTEIINASNRGTMMGLQSSRVALRKVWISTPDGRAREEHIAADGQEVDINGQFTVGGEDLEYPGDPYGSPWNVIQCRCTVAGVT